jgi:hypothetical protein
LLGTASSVLMISDLGLKRLHSIFGSEKLQRKLVSDIQSLLAILGSDSSCLLQHAHDGVSSLVQRVVVTWGPLWRRCERNNSVWHFPHDHTPHAG